MASLNIARRSPGLRSLAVAALFAAAAHTAAADLTLTYEIDGQAGTAGLTGANLNVSRMAQWDMETGLIAKDLPETLTGGPVYVTRVMDEASTSFIAAVVSGEPVGDMTIRFDSGMAWTLKGARLNNYGTYFDGETQLENFEIVPAQTDITMGDRTVSIVSQPIE